MGLGDGVDAKHSIVDHRDDLVLRIGCDRLPTTRRRRSSSSRGGGGEGRSQERRETKHQIKRLETIDNRGHHFERG